ncbi:AraC-like DNA-binding protein/ligand-binding sensor protein [Anaerotaenia torta]|uniref:helix-turn-helix domain-containing protein n=1 Tax=Anaerotaenia torta TaxID=433293 RepID=UPI003D1C0469
MMERYETLTDLLRLLSGYTKAHVCVHDVSGILKSRNLNLDFNNQIHSKPFCTAAKSSPKGYRMCTWCKIYANRKASLCQTMFYDHCPYGLFEIVKPVIIDGKLQCIIYIGNLICDYEETIRKIHRTCMITKVNPQDLLLLVKDAQPILSPDYYLQFASLIDSYIRLLNTHMKDYESSEGLPCHWAVSALQNYIHSNYSQGLSLQSVSKLYFINDKYIGRVFKKQMGYTFHEYLNKVRLEHAVKLLTHTSNKIITIALDCGFQNVTYFNRSFLKQYGLPPVKYRQMHSRQIID